jgi:cytochrome c-type biogenesis protein CcmF
LMSLAPFFAWRKQGIRNLLHFLLIPLIGSAVATIIWGYLHRMHPNSIFALWLASFVTVAILYEFSRGIRARMITQKENPLLALVNLIRRNHRRYGGYIIHLGVIMIALGFIGEAYFKQETQGTVGVGESLTIGGYKLRFEGLREYPGSDGRDIIEASASLFQGDQLIRVLQPRRDYFIVQKQPSTVPAVYSTPGEDVYVLLAGWDESGANNATFKIYINPLINWVWIGAFFMVLGTLITTLPSGKHEISYALKAVELQPIPGD